MDFKIENNLFLGRQELDFFKNSLKEKGYITFFKQLIKNYGVVRNELNDPSFNYLKIVQGTSFNKLSIKAGVAIDKNINGILIENDIIDILSVPGDNLIRYVIAKYAIELREEGVLDISANGVLTGTGTLFTEKLRGLPDFPSKISFPGSSNNTGEYIIQSVTDDITAQLNIASGLLVAETGLKYQIVGTFAPGIPVPGIDKYPFQNDGYSIRLDLSPTLISGEEFLLAVVISNGITTGIADKRLTNILEINPADTLDPSQTNPVIGVVYAQHHNPYHNNDTNRIKIGWGFKSISSTWTYNSVLNQITISAGSGGHWLNTTGFTNGDFDGWNCHFDQNGDFANIISSSISGSNIILQLAPTGTIFTSSDITINPKATQIEIITSNSLLPNDYHVTQFDIASGEGIVEAQAHLGTVKIQFRHINFDKKTAVLFINNGSYLKEGSFDTSGNITSPVIGTITSSTITLDPYTDNFYQAKAWINKPNAFTGIQQFNRGSDIVYTGLNGLLPINNSGNTFRVIVNSPTTVTWMNSFGDGTFICLHIVAGTSSVLRFETMGGMAMVPGANRVDVELDNGYTYAEFQAGDTLYFVNMSPTSGTSKWRLIGSKSSANAKRQIDTINSAWTNVVLDGTNVVQNTAESGTGTDTPLNGSLGTQAPQIGSYLRYKVIGKTVHVNFYVTGIVLTQAGVVSAGSIIFKNTIPAPMHRVNASCSVHCTTNAGVMVGQHQIELLPGSNNIVCSARGLDEGGTSWNRTYAFATTTSVSVQVTGSTTFNPGFDIGGSFTYEIS